MHALLFIGSKRLDYERHERLSFEFAAAQGDPKAIKQLLKTMERNLD